MVLVDSSHPDQDERFPPGAKKLAAASCYVIRAMQITLPIGLPRLLASRAAPPEVRSLTEPVNREWGKMQEELAHLSSNGSHIVAKGSGHDIQIDHREAVVDAIREVVGKAKGSN